MARWSERTRFEIGDEVANGDARGVVVWSDFAGRSGKKFPVVRITSGPGVGGSKPIARYPWVPLLDYEPRTSRFRCGSCDRTYWAPRSRGWCRQCVRKDEADARHGTTMAGPGRQFASDGTGHAINPAPAPPKDRDDGSPF